MGSLASAFHCLESSKLIRSQMTVQGKAEHQNKDDETQVMKVD